ncbi:MAG: VOC family protein [Hyphomicrobium sp.]
MQPRLTLITLGVADMPASRKFYEALGFKASSDSGPQVTFFDAGGVILALFARDALAEDANVANSSPGFSGVTLAHNVASEGDVDCVLAEAVRAGAAVLKPAGKTFWGGYAAYFADLDGHIWEVAHNPFWPLDADGRPTLPPPPERA